MQQQQHRCSKFEEIWPNLHLDINNKYSYIYKLSIEGHRIENLNFLNEFQQTLEYLNVARNNIRLSTRHYHHSNNSRTMNNYHSSKSIEDRLAGPATRRRRLRFVRPDEVCLAGPSTERTSIDRATHFGGRKTPEKIRG